MQISIMGKGTPSKITFFPLRGTYPLSKKSFCQKNLSRNGGNPLDGKSAKHFLEINFHKRTENDVFVLNKVKNGPKRPYNRPKRANKV